MTKLGVILACATIARLLVPSRWKRRRNWRRWGAVAGPLAAGRWRGGRRPEGAVVGDATSESRPAPTAMATPPRAGTRNPLQHARHTDDGQHRVQQHKLRRPTAPEPDMTAIRLRDDPKVRRRRRPPQTNLGDTQCLATSSTMR